jgi:hypothetical protein
MVVLVRVENDELLHNLRLAGCAHIFHRYLNIYLDCENNLTSMGNSFSKEVNTTKEPMFVDR